MRQTLSYTVLPAEICIQSDTENYTIQFFSATTMRICRTADKNHVSFAIENLPPFHTDFCVNPSEDSGLQITTSYLDVRISPDLKIDIYDNRGTLLLADYRGDRVTTQTLSEEQMALVAMEGHQTEDTTAPATTTILKKLEPSTYFYGLGDKTGYLNKRGYEYMMWNTDNPEPQLEIPTFKAMYKSVPFFIAHSASGNYGIFFDNQNRTYFDMGYESNEYYCIRAEQGAYDYYFFGGDTMADILKEYTRLTGRAPLPQMWTLGYHQSRWSYSSAKEILSLADTFRREQIPCDCIHMDIDYMDAFKVFTWNETLYGEGNSLAGQMSKNGFKLVSIIDPGVKVEPGYDVYDTGVRNRYFATDAQGEIYKNVVWPGDSVFPAFTDDTVRIWWGGLQKHLLERGIRGIWNDMNEPASFRGPLPDDICFSDGNTTWKHSEIHNVYGHLMSKATYEGLKQYDKKRPFVITRACYSGSQKYACVWSGDNHSIWAHLQMAIPQLCNLGMSGICFAGTDIGGFGSHTTKELLCRWVEVGCFSPLFRNHSAKLTRRQEPFAFDTETINIYRKYVNLRYKLLPYYYDLFWEHTKNGLPIMRPLALHYEQDKNTLECNDMFLIGEQLLAAPVVNQGQEYRLVYLPEGTWIDYWNHREYAGNAHYIYHAPLDTCPLFVKAGAILPTYPAQQYVGEKAIDSIHFEIYISSNDTVTGHYTHYLDNGTDFAYEQGRYTQYEISLQKNRQVDIQIVHDGYENAYTSMTYDIIEPSGSAVSLKG